MKYIQQWFKKFLFIISELDTNTTYKCYNCKDTGCIQSDGMELSSMYEACSNCQN